LFVDIEANMKLFTDTQTDERTDKRHHHYTTKSCFNR